MSHCRFQFSLGRWSHRAVLAALCCLAPLPAFCRAVVPAGRADGLPSNTIALIQSGIAHLYNLECDAADAIFTRVTAANSNHPIGYVYLALNAMVRVMVHGESPLLLDTLQTRVRSATQCALRNVSGTRDAWSSFYAGAAFLLQACWDGKQENYFSALHWLKRAISQLSIARSSPAARSDAAVMIGAYQYFLSQSPWCFRFFSSLLIAPNDRRQGFEALKHGAEQALFTRNEARLLLVTAYTWDHQTERAHECVDILLKRFPRNLLLPALKEQILIQEHRYQDALALATASLYRVSVDARLLPLLPDRLYDAGMLYMYQSNYSRALACFSRAWTAGTNKPALRAWAAVRNGMMCDMLGRRPAARRWYAAAADMSRRADLAAHYASVFLQDPYRGQLFE